MIRADDGDLETILMPGAPRRRRAYTQLVELIERHLEDLGDRRVAPELSYAEFEERLRGFDFGAPVALGELVDAVGDLLGEGIVHTSHPRYFGLFNPAPTFAAILADALVAAFNPQLAVTSHVPAAGAIERHVLSFVKAARMTGLGSLPGCRTGFPEQAAVTEQQAGDAQYYVFS